MTNWARLPDDYPTLTFETPSDWSDWLEANHSKVPGLWLRLGRKNGTVRAIMYAQAVQEALRYGWIDGQTKSLDESTFLQKFTPRRKGSIWSKVNREKVLALEAAGLMKPSGLAEVEKAKANGRWDNAYSNTAPPELEAALNRNKKAKKFYESLDRRNHMALHFRIRSLRKAESRERKAAEFVAMLAEGRKLL